VFGVDETYDVVVVGGGAAGLSGALALGRARRSVLVVDSGDPRNAPAGHVHNYLGREGTPPGELLAIGRAEVAQYGVQIEAGAVTKAAPTDRGFTVQLEDGRQVQARRLLATTGLTDELPDLPGLAQAWGRNVLHCPYCHGWEVRDKPLGILGTGPFGVHQALLFRQWTTDLTFFLHTAPALTAEEREQLDARGITVVEGPVAAWEDGGVRMLTGELVPRTALVVSPVFTARAAVLESLGLRTTPVEMAGHVVGSQVASDPAGLTDAPGVWVAGNVADVRAQVIGSAAAGLAAGAAINADLIAEETRLAVERARVT
jgi:thioredoxin reductase